MRTLQNSRIIVVKIGTSTITKEDGSADLDFLRDIARQVSELKDKKKCNVVIVTSGAIGLGVKELALKQKPRDIALRQATASIGQTILMQSWRDAFAQQNIKVAQLLLTYNTFTDRQSYLNLKNALTQLFVLDVVPIINENDSISIAEIDASFGDNDRLSAIVASKIEADLLILLSTISGLYDKNPKDYKNAKIISEVTSITDQILAAAGKSSGLGSGGMKTKLDAAKLCNNAGTVMVIANGKEKNVLPRILSNEELGTIFYPSKKIPNKKRWIIFAPAAGKLVVDDCVQDLLNTGKNLLPAGINTVIGDFNKTDVVDLVYKEKTFAKAIVDYDSATLDKIKKQSGHKNAVKRENLVIL